MKFSQNTIENIMSAANLHDVIAEFVHLNKAGKDYYGKCPFCDKDGKDKGLKVSSSKNIYKCFSCDKGGNSAVTFLMDSQNKTYPEALQYLAEKYNIVVENDRPEPQRKTKSSKTYRDKQLDASGLSDADQKAMVYVDDDTQKLVDIYEAGTLDEYGRIIHGDDMIIWYYGLDGKPVMYQKPKTSRFEKLFRIRWQNPDLHPDKNGRPVKYKSPYGSGSHLYIPQLIRNIYNDGRIINTLYIQEGEKKSDKACKHGIPSVGIMGIQNIGQNGRLPMEIQLIVQRCKVKNVVLVLDSDWDELSHVIKPDQQIEQRPRSFFSAVRNFKEYFLTFKNQGIYLELYFAFGNDKQNKGIDDLLTNVLKNKEIDLVNDIEKAINEKDGSGKYITLHKITTLPDLKLYEYWNLHSIESFCKRYKEEILKTGLQEFRYSKHIWKLNADGFPELAQPLQDEETFWENNTYTDQRGREHENYKFKYTRAYNFLRNRGFGRVKLSNPNPFFCQVENKVVRIVEPWEIKDFVMDMAKEIVPEAILDMLYRGGKMYFGPDSLGNLSFVYPTFELADKDFQYLFFNEKYWKITQDRIEEKPMSELEKFVWHEKINFFNASLLPGKMISAAKITQTDADEMPALKNFVGKYDVKWSKDAEKCHFLHFLYNTSNFYWETEQKGNKLTIEEQFENNLHFLSKLTAIGYLLHRYRNKSCEKAVICMDGRNSEVGESWGRTGKSLFGMAISKVVPQAYIGAKNKNLTEDPFWAEEVTEKIDNIFLDDVRANLDFEFFFPVITGRLTVNVKGQKKFTLSENDTPKLLITTNHSIGGESSSYRDRQMLVAFSDFYNDKRKPIDDFKQNFWVEWEADQWNLFYNLMANCLQLYFTFGLVEAPMERLELRRMRQFMGEDFLTWANEYFGTSDDESADEIYGPNINLQIVRREMFNDFLDKNPTTRKYMTATKFKKKITSFCKYKGLSFNPQIQDENGVRGGDDKTGGIEYFTIANSKYFG